MQCALELYSGSRVSKRAMCNVHTMSPESSIKLFGRGPFETALECLYGRALWSRTRLLHSPGWNAGISLRSIVSGPSVPSPEARLAEVVALFKEVLGLPVQGL